MPVENSVVHSYQTLFIAFISASCVRNVSVVGKTFSELSYVRGGYQNSLLFERGECSVPLGKWHPIKALRGKPKVMEFYNIVQVCISIFANLNIDAKITSPTLTVQLIKIFEMENHREV
jgi:hypothetical protein